MENQKMFDRESHRMCLQQLPRRNQSTTAPQTLFPAQVRKLWAKNCLVALSIAMQTGKWPALFFVGRKGQGTHRGPGRPAAAQRTRSKQPLYQRHHTAPCWEKMQNLCIYIYTCIYNVVTYLYFFKKSRCCKLKIKCMNMYMYSANVCFHLFLLPPAADPKSFT